MSQIKSKQLKLVAAGDLIIGGAGGAGTILSKGANVTFLRVNGSGVLAWSGIAASEISFTPIGNIVATDTQSAVAGLDSRITATEAGVSKASARVSSTANVTISGPGTTIDGVTLNTGDRVLLKNQTTASQNGMYVFQGSGSTMTRTTDSSTWNSLVSQNISIDEGTVNADTGWVSTADRGGTIGTTAVNYIQDYGVGTYTALSSTNGITLSVRDFQLTGQALALHQFASNGILVRTGAATFAARSIAVGSGLTVSNVDGTAGNPTVSLGTELLGLSGLAATGIISRTGTGTYSPRTITNSGAGVTVTNGDGVAGAPTIALSSSLASLSSVTWASGTQVPVLTAANTYSLLTVGVAAATNLLDRQSADTRYLQLSGGTLTGTLNLTAGTTTVQPLKFAAGTNLTTPVVGSMEFDGTSLFITQTSGPTRQTLAYLASPTFTGTPAAPTAAVDTNTTQLATTAFVLNQAASSNPLMDGSVTVGTSTRFARQDHVHPVDTSRAPVANPTFTGTVTMPTGTVSAQPVKFVSGTNLTTATAGSMEYDGTNLYFTPVSTRRTVAYLDSNITGTSANVTGTVAIANGGTGATTAPSALTNLGAVALAGSTMTGLLILSADPSAALGAATKQYVDNKITALGSVFDYRGTLTGGASSGAATDLDALAYKNPGDYYKVTTAGYFKYVDSVPSTQTFFANINDGLVRNTNTGWDKIDNTDSVTTGTTNRTTVTGTTDTGFVVDISAAYVGQTSLTTLGTITTGTWNGSVVSMTYGGTGSNLSALTANQILIANGTSTSAIVAPTTGYLRWTGSAYAWAAAVAGATQNLDEFVPALAANAAVTLTQTPVGSIAVYFNGLKLRSNGYSLSGTTVTLNDSNVGYSVDGTDIIAVAYAY